MPPPSEAKLRWGIIDGRRTEVCIIGKEGEEAVLGLPWRAEYEGTREKFSVQGRNAAIGVQACCYRLLSSRQRGD